MIQFDVGTRFSTVFNTESEAFRFAMINWPDGGWWIISSPDERQSAEPAEQQFPPTDEVESPFARSGRFFSDGY